MEDLGWEVHVGHTVLLLTLCGLELSHMATPTAKGSRNIVFSVHPKKRNRLDKHQSLKRRRTSKQFHWREQCGKVYKVKDFMV